MACENLITKLKSLQAERTDLQNELKGAPPGEKPYIAAQIKKLNKDITQAQAAVDACLIVNGLGPVVATLPGTVTLTTTHPNASGPFVEEVTIVFSFAPGRTKVSIMNFSPIVTEADTDLGKNITTVTLDSGEFGSSNPDTGALTIGGKFKFDHSIDIPIPFYEEDSILPCVLTTGKFGSMQGAPMNQSTGAVTLVGGGTFQGGILGGETGQIKITGTINPIP